jgi:benzoylformate decarboxylase
MQAHLPIVNSETFYTMCSGGLGYGMPAAVGVALAKPNSRVIAVIGDGSAMYSIQALNSAARLQLPITFVVLNNGRYAALQDFAPVFNFRPGEHPQGTDLAQLDFVALAKGHGVQAIRVNRALDLRDVLTQALRSSAPMLVEIEVD